MPGRSGSLLSQGGQELARLLETSFQGTGLGSVHRSREQITSFFEGLELLRPARVEIRSEG